MRCAGRGKRAANRGRCPQCGVGLSLLVRAFGVAKDADGEVFDVGGPLRRQLEKLDVVPLDAVDGNCGQEQRDDTQPRWKQERDYQHQSGIFRTLKYCSCSLQC